MTAHLQRAILLIEQSRYELAESELQQAFGQDPNDSRVHAYYAICLVELKKFNEARQAVANALKLDAGTSFNFYVASLVSTATNDYQKGQAYIEEAIQLEPYCSHYHGQLASIHISLKNWQQALDVSNTGLEIDPEDTFCANMRATAQVKLGQKMDAGASLQSALRRQPENATTHANQGWALLHESKPKEAMPHFREALRLEPNMEWARSGIIEAMKSQYFVYRIMLNWFLWCSKLKGQTLWMIIMGGYFGYRILMSLAENVPVARPFVIPFIALYLAFVLMTWVSVPLFNLLLRFNKFGRMALSDEEKRTSVWVGLCLLVAAIFVGCYFVIGSEEWLIGALSVALMAPTLGLYYSSEEGWPRAVHSILLLTMTFLATLVVFGLMGSVFLKMDLWNNNLQELSLGIFVISHFPLLLLGFVSQFGVQFLAAARPIKGTNTAYWVWVFGGIGLGALICVYMWMIGMSLMIPDVN